MPMSLIVLLLSAPHNLLPQVRAVLCAFLAADSHVSITVGGACQFSMSIIYYLPGELVSRIPVSSSTRSRTFYTYFQIQYQSPSQESSSSCNGRRSFYACLCVGYDHHSGRLVDAAVRFLVRICIALIDIISRASSYTRYTSSFWHAIQALAECLITCMSHRPSFGYTYRPIALRV